MTRYEAIAFFVGVWVGAGSVGALWWHFSFDRKHIGGE